MIKKIIKWGKKSSINVGIIGMVIMFILETILILPVMIPLLEQYGWNNPLPTKYITYFASCILISFWLSFEITHKLLKLKW